MLFDRTPDVQNGKNKRAQCDGKDGKSKMYLITYQDTKSDELSGFYFLPFILMSISMTFHADRFKTVHRFE